MNDYATRVRRTYVGAYAIEYAHQLNDMITGKLKRGAMKLSDERIPRLQNKLRFAMAFYEGIDQIFKDNDTVPLTHEWRAKNYQSNVVRYAAWAMRNPQHGVDRLLFKPQATLIRRVIKTTVLPSFRSIQYMIFDDRLTDAPITKDILEVTLEQANAYKDKILNVTPKKQRPQQQPGTVEKNPKRKGEESDNPRDQKPGGAGLKIQTNLTDGGFKRDVSRGRSSRRAGGVPRKRPSRSPPITGFYRTSKPFSPPPQGDGKERARSVTPNQEETTSEEFKVKLKF